MGEAQDVDILAGGWEPRMGLKLLDDCRVSMRLLRPTMTWPGRS